jgi:ribonuclease P protein component
MRRSLSRDERLRKSRDIGELFAAAPRIEARGMRLLYRANGSAATRFAVVITRGCGGAVKRNREKRLTREAWRSLKAGVPSGFDVVFLVTRFGVSYADRRAAMEHLVRRARWRAPGRSNGAPGR